MKVLSRPWHKISMAVCLMLIAFMMPACAKPTTKNTNHQNWYPNLTFAQSFDL
ncbi:hypothetical protein [Moraxella sp. VT-16-12]|uniref:hypothetical protein n=1 Tax=Moraxella sp. VT-16-12 TaxID=2014877 RepID=UPI001648E7CA|nr:hypothetical protein [Moraxella sp. VT-16-12]